MEELIGRGERGLFITYHPPAVGAAGLPAVVVPGARVGARSALAVGSGSSEGEEGGNSEELHVEGIEVVVCLLF